MGWVEAVFSWTALCGQASVVANAAARHNRVCMTAFWTRGPPFGHAIPPAMPSCISAIMVSMQNILPVLCFVAGFALAWLLLRSSKREASAALHDRDTRIADLQNTLSTLTAREAELQARIDSERRAAAEKLDLLDQTRQKLTEAFKALSSDALARNNQAFLELARATLAQTQESARGDLDLRQQAIAELVTPVRASLEKVDSKIHGYNLVQGKGYKTCGLNIDPAPRYAEIRT